MAGKLLVLIIESDQVEISAIAKSVEAQGYDTVCASDGTTGLRQFFNSHPDLVVLSLDVPELPVWELVERLRALADTPIIVTAAEASAASLQRAFDLRVDGFLVEPFEPKELIVRLNAVRDRISGDNGHQRWLYQRNGLAINWRSCEVTVDGQPVELTGTEFKLLAYLVERRGWVLSHDQILSEVWGPEYTGEKDRVKLYVWYLRQKIEHNPSQPQLIRTKRGLGYTFVG
ncbi:MAG: response regulator transcription factor [Chloroflexi bacterium]|nr:response regulator transcription factor [Chloroflexota bacterium]